MDQEEDLMANLRLWVKPRRTPAAFALFLVRLIGRGAAWLNIRFVEGK